MSDRVDHIREKLYREEGGNIFAVLDGASIGGLLQKLADHEPEHQCLYGGELKPDMAEVAPYLVKLDSDSPFTDWVLDRGWGNHWGILVESGGDLGELSMHLKQFVVVYDDNAKPLYFRFYDPRVLRVHLPTCNGQELNEMFGPVDAYMMEDESGAALLRFRLKDGALTKHTEQVS